MPRKKLRIGMHCDLSDPIAERPLGGMLRFAAARRDVLLCDCRVSLHDIDFRTSNPPWKGRVDGVVLSISLERPEEPDVIARWVARGGVPAVSTAGDILHPRLPVVCTAVASIARLAADHLVQCGCRSFLHAGYLLSMGSRRRAEAFRNVLAVRGFDLTEFEFAVRIMDETEFATLADDAARLARLLESLPKPLGVLALGDPFARGVLQVCDSLGLQVPRQVAIVGVNDTPLAFAQRPTLTSIGYPGEKVGQAAMTLLLRLIDGARRPRRPIEIPATQLFVRESTTGSVEEGDELAKAVEMVRRHACSGLTVGDLVESLSVSRRWLELEFRKHLGRSPNEEIQRVRLFHAEQMLHLTDIPITRVAELVGFSESSGLTHFFQNHTSYSPTAYRQWAHSLRKS